MRYKSFFQLVFFVIVCECAGIIGSFFTIPSISTWYVPLHKPPVNPPNWIFGPVWTILFALMGIAACIVWQKKSDEKRKRKALSVFCAQLALNVLWSVLFFGLHRSGIAFVDIMFLWLGILWLIILFWRISRPASYLLMPYIAWVSFAGYLNFMIWKLNSHV